MKNALRGSLAFAVAVALASSMVSAQEDFESDLETNKESSRIGFNAGLNSLENDNNKINLKNLDVGVFLDLANKKMFNIYPRLEVDYTSVDGYDNVGVNSLLRGSLNGVYALNADGTFSPYVLGGLGYEKVSDSVEGYFESTPFVQAGAGVSYKPTKRLKLHLEGKSVDVFAKNQNNEVIVKAGVSMAIGGKKSSAPIDNDEDKDGVPNHLDQCPGTPTYFSVDAKGCPQVATLRVHFAYDRADILPRSIPKIRDFANYLLKNKGLGAKIVGHTDSDGSDAYNMILSKKRAIAVRNKLIEFGVSAIRLQTEGRGERDPIASNATEEGKYLNRRIEAELIYP